MIRLERATPSRSKRLQIFHKVDGLPALSGQAVVRLALENDRVVGEERLLTDRRERIREVVEGPDGGL